MISSSQRPIPDITQHSQQTNLHAPGGIRTHKPIRPAATGTSKVVSETPDAGSSKRCPATCLKLLFWDKTPCYMLPSFTLTVEFVGSSVTLVNLCHTIRRHPTRTVRRTFFFFVYSAKYFYEYHHQCKRALRSEDKAPHVPFSTADGSDWPFST